MKSPISTPNNSSTIMKQQLVSPHLYSRLPQECNTGAATTYSSYVTPLYYIAKWYLLSFPCQMSCPKEASKIAHGYNFIETNLGKHNLAKLTNKQVTQNLQHHQCGPIIQDGFSLIIISLHGPSLALAALLWIYSQESYLHNFQHNSQLKIKHNCTINWPSCFATIRINGESTSIWNSDSITITQPYGSEPCRNFVIS